MFYPESQQQQEFHLEQAIRFAPSNTGPRGLPKLDLPPQLQTVLRQPPSPPARYAPLPQVDIVVIFYTSAEYDAFHYVHTNAISPLPQNPERNDIWRAFWHPYERNFYRVSRLGRRSVREGSILNATSPDSRWGSWFRFDIGDKRVLAYKSNLHLNQDGEALPLERMLEQILHDCQPSLVLSTGTAGATRATDLLGDVVITPAARFRLSDEFASADFNDQTYTSSWTPPVAHLELAQSLFLPVSEITAHDPLGGPTTFTPAVSRGPIIHQEKSLPVLTTDYFEFGSTTNGLDQLGCAIEMDDAVVAMVCSRRGVPFGFIRNLSDPVSNGLLPYDVQSAWAVRTYQIKGLLTSFNSALTVLALLAGS